MLEGKTANANQSINQSVSKWHVEKKTPCILFLVHIGNLHERIHSRGFNKVKATTQTYLCCEKNLTTFPVTYARAKLGKIAALFPGDGVY